MNHNSIFNLKKYCTERKKRGIDRDLASATSLLKYIQELGLGQTKIQNKKLLSGIRQVAGTPAPGGGKKKTGPFSNGFPGLLAGSWIGSETTGDWSPYGMLAVQTVDSNFFHSSYVISRFSKTCFRVLIYQPICQWLLFCSYLVKAGLEVMR